MQACPGSPQAESPARRALCLWTHLDKRRTDGAQPPLAILITTKAAWRVGEQSACRQLRVLQPHGDVEPVCDRSRGDAGVGEIRSQAGTAVGERGHLCGSGSADCLEAPANLNCNGGAGSGDGTEDLSPAVGCLDVANTNFQMPVTCLAATNECRIRGHSDAHG